MSFQNLFAVEHSLRCPKNKGGLVYQPFLSPVPQKTQPFNLPVSKPKVSSGNFFNEVDAKQRIVLNFPAGNLRNDTGPLTLKDHHVAVSYIIASDGIVYQLYLSKYWSGNTGKDGNGHSNPKNAEDKSTIGIELSNYGPLHEEQGFLKTMTGDTYCTLNDTDAYQKLTSPAKVESYYATFTDAQYTSLTILVRHLTAKYKIPRQFLPEPQRYTATKEVFAFKGIVSHVNYYPGGQWDMSPVFNWNRLIQDVQAQTFTPPASRDVEFLTSLR